MAHNTLRFLTSVGSDEKDQLSFYVLPVLLLRLLYSQVWISVSRHQTDRSKHRIVNFDFDQVDRERNWHHVFCCPHQAEIPPCLVHLTILICKRFSCRDDQILLTVLLFYVVNTSFPVAHGLPWWNSKGLVILEAENNLFFTYRKLCDNDLR
jgi:aldehyde decarbonylase